MARIQRSGPPPGEAAPSGHITGSHHTADTGDSSPYRRQDGYAAPDLEDRLDAQALDAARARGFAVAVPCTRCGQWVVAPKSVALHMGPVCRAKSAAEVVAR
ncbi:MAG TPA: hypothetical protein PKK01_16870 [Mycobacterium sp.]|nr:hypothetical protein [Mycobacterium sp.]